MGHLLKNVNPEAAERMENPVRLPGVGETVLYCPRPSEQRSRREKMPAFVMRRDEENEVLDLLVFLGVEDYLELENVPVRRGEDRGWEPLEGRDQAGGADELKAFKDLMRSTLFGETPDGDLPNEGLLELIDKQGEVIAAQEKALHAMEKRLAALEAKAPKPKKKPRQRVRPQDALRAG